MGVRKSLRMAQIFAGKGWSIEECEALVGSYSESSIISPATTISS